MERMPLIRLSTPPEQPLSRQIATAEDPMITIRVSRAEREHLKRVAKSRGCSVNMLARAALGLPDRKPKSSQGDC